MCPNAETSNWLDMFLKHSYWTCLRAGSLLQGIALTCCGQVLQGLQAALGLQGSWLLLPSTEILGRIPAGLKVYPTKIYAVDTALFFLQEWK